MEVLFLTATVYTLIKCRLSDSIVPNCQYALRDNVSFLQLPTASAAEKSPFDEIVAIAYVRRRLDASRRHGTMSLRKDNSER